MSTPPLSSIPAEVIEHIVAFLQPADVFSFRLSCRQNEQRSFQAFATRFFSTCTTSLIGSSLARLQAISSHPPLRKYVKTIQVEDDSPYVDLWNSTQPWYLLRSEQPTYIWPRSQTGYVLDAQIGVRSLQAMLRTGHLRPDLLRVQDYRISNVNLGKCSEAVQHRVSYRPGPLQQRDLGPVAALGKAILDSTGVAIVSFRTEPDSSRFEDGPCYYGMEQVPEEASYTLCNPHVNRMSIWLSPAHQGEELASSLLRSADVQAGQYWLHVAACSAPLLRDLRIGRLEIPACLTIATPALERLQLNCLTVPASFVLALLKQSHDSLQRISLEAITLCDGTRWDELLDTIGSTHRVLASFSILLVYDGRARNSAVSFIGFQRDQVAQECRPGLQLVIKGPADNKRMTKVHYQGPSAGAVMRQLARHAL